MSMFNKISVSVAVALTLVSIGGMTAAAQAQSGKRIVVAMAPSDDAATPESRAVRAPVRAASTPRVKHVAMAPAPKASSPDCFWCNREVFISGLTY